MDSKYHYLLWRPATAVRAADADGNAATAQDGNVVAAPDDAEPPRVPERARLRDGRHGRGTRVGAEDEEHQRRRPRSDRWRHDARPTSRHFNTSDELIADVANARVWAGLHYRFSTTAGVELGKAVAKWDLDHFGK